MFKRCWVLGAVAILTVTSTAHAQPGGFPGGFPGGPAPQQGQILPNTIQDQLKLSAEQKKEVEALQKELDARLAKILTAEQNKSLKEIRSRPPGFGPGFGPPGGGFGPPGGGFGGPGGGFGPPGGGFGGFGANRLDDVKKQIDATDEEWKVISVKLQKVVTARQVLNSDPKTPAGFGGFGASNANPITQAQNELRTVLKEPKHTKAEVDEHVAAIRRARQKARADLDAAQKDLLPLLTASQEATLISLGYLD